MGLSIVDELLANFLAFGTAASDADIYKRTVSWVFDMSEKAIPHHAAPGSFYNPYATGMTLGNNGYPAMSGHALNPLSSMSTFKTALPNIPQATIDFAKNSRSSQNTPIMVMPSGQTVPLSALYAQNTSSMDASLPYVGNNMMTGFVGGAGYTPNMLPQSNWPYGIQNGYLEHDSTRRNNWPGDENSALNPGYAAANAAAQPEYYNGSQFTHPATTMSNHYTPGPIQPMKTADNKGYEMVNLDELVAREPVIPRAVPALWTNQEDLTLAKCLQNPEGITNIYIRGFMPETTDEDLESWAARFGEIESCKAIIDQDTGKCKGFGFVMYYSPAAAENCIRGFFHLGFQASYAQKSRNARLKDLEDKSSTNIYCTGIPIDWNESHLAKHFLPYHAVSTKICRDSPSGVSKEVGFARFETRQVAESVLREFHSVLNPANDTKLYLRFADTKAQKQLKQQSQERRQWRSREYSYSVEHTPSPLTGRLQSITHISPNDSYHSPAGISNNFTPATSVSPPEAANANKATSERSGSWPTSGGLQTITNQGSGRTNVKVSLTGRQYVRPYVEDAASTSSGKTGKPEVRLTQTPSPKKVTIKVEPASGGKENVTITPPTR